MKKVFSFLLAVAIGSPFITLEGCRGESHTESGITVTTLHRGNITYLVFELNGAYGGIDVRNYTQDSLDWEFLHSPTKTTDYGPDKSQTEQAQQSVRTVRRTPEFPYERD